MPFISLTYIYTYVICTFVHIHFIISFHKQAKGNDSFRIMTFSLALVVVVGNSIKLKLKFMSERAVRVKTVRGVQRAHLS
jgi:hypothetical protein